MLLLGDARRGDVHEARREDAARERRAHRDEVEREVLGARVARASASISGMCWWSSGLYVRRFTRAHGVVRARAAAPTPLPLEPVMPTASTAPVEQPRLARAAAAPSSIVVAKQPGEAT